MNQLVKNNITYFYLTALFLLFGCITLFFIEKGDVITLFNSNRTTFLDFLFIYGTQLAETIPVIIFFVILLFIRFKYSLTWAILVLVLLLSSFGLKSIFQQPRPYKYYNQQGTWEQFEPIEGIYLNRGDTSFPSGHTMAGFAFFGLLAFFSRFKSIKLLCFVGAVIVGLSRIYLIQHFLEDIVLGAFIGTLIAMLMYQLQERLPKDELKWYNKRIRIN